MNTQNKTASISSNKSSLSIDYFKKENTSSALITLKYPMLIFANQYFKESETKTLLKKLLMKSKLTFLLNVTDIFFTWFFVVKNNKFFIELNPMAFKIIYNLPLTICIKLSIVTLILLYLIIRAKTFSAKGLKRINLTLNLILLLYISINLIHIVNLIILILIQIN